MRGLPFFKPKKGIQFAGEGFTGSSGGGGGGGSSLTISETETKVGTYAGVDLYSRVFKNVSASTGFRSVVTEEKLMPIFGFLGGVASDGNYYFNPCKINNGGTASENRINYAYVGVSDFAQTADLIVFYTK